MIIRNYNDAHAWMQGGRKKYDRPMYYRGLRLQSRGQDIAIYEPWSKVDIVLLHQDGSMTMQAPMMTTHWGGHFSLLRSQGIRYTLSAISNVWDIYQKNYECYVVPVDAPTSPSKVQGCRSCKSSGLVDLHCYGKTCYNGTINDEGIFSCPDHTEVDYAPGTYVRWHPTACEHGVINKHVIPKGQPCWYCAGSGKREYGLKRIPIKWDGSPLRLKDGKVVKKQLTDLEKRIASYVNNIT